MSPVPKPMRVLLISPLPPPAGGIASWTTILLKGIQPYPEIRIRHLGTAVRWKTTVNRSRLLQLVGGSIQAMRDIARVLCATIVFRPHVIHLTSAAGYASLKDFAVMLIARIFARGGVIHYHTSRVARDHDAADWGFRTGSAGNSFGCRWGRAG
jgi:hypothetical protein